MQTVSFIIISYNRPLDTIAAVKSILQLNQAPGYQKDIVVINNGSTANYEPFTHFINTLPPNQKEWVNYVPNPTNLGVAQGRNLGVQLAKGDLLIFIDDDAEFEKPDALTIALSLLAEHEQKNGVKILAFREYRTTTGEYYIASKNKQRAQLPQFLTNYYVGSGHLIKREVFNTVGYYTTEFFYGMEEYDLAYKALNAGFRILYTAQITVLHKKSPDGRQATQTLTRWNLENKTVVAYKYLPWLYVCTHLIFWSGYFLYTSGFKIGSLFTAFINIYQKIGRTTRTPVSASTLAYIQSVKGRLWY